MRFSERVGIRPVKNVIQVNSMDEGLRNRLWNVLQSECWRTPRRYDGLSNTDNCDLKGLLYSIWHNHLKLPTDDIPYSSQQAVAHLRQYFFTCQWYEVYDLVEFIANAVPQATRASIMRDCTQVLEQELSGYRFVASKLTPITTSEEVTAIEHAVAETATPFPGATIHLRTAIERLAQKPEGDYRNSIKESISAVESVCQAITSNPKATLGQALKAIDPKAELHGALRAAFDKLYGYTSDEGGIRHALLDEDHLEQEDAVFMLVACSAFVSYVIAKRARKP